MTKRKKLIAIGLLAGLCLSALVFVGVRGLDASAARADSDCVHSYVLTGAAEATCMVDAYDVYECEYCGDVAYDYHLDTALGHNWDDEENIIRIEPGCTTMGMDYHVCTRCWNTYQSDPVSPLGHEWADPAGTVFTATCYLAGYTEFTCVREGCGYSYKTDETPMLEHSYALDEERSSVKTCTEDGVSVYVCTMCKGEKTEYDYATGHVYTDVTTAAGCISYGYTTHTCSVCGSRYVTDYVSPSGHVFELTEVTASETSYGYVMLTCGVCGYIYVTNIVTSGDSGYTHDYVLRIHAATCYEGGYWEYVCADCGDTIICNQTAALVHEWEREYREPTCTEDGGWVYVCHNCESWYYDTVEYAAGHDYEETVTQPTCTEDGYSMFVCLNCGDIYYGNYTAATGHAYEVRNAVVSTSQRTLSLSYVCPGCGSSAVSRLQVVFTDSYGNAYAFYFSSNGTANFSSLPDGNYTASVVDTYLDKTVSAFTISGSFSSGTSDSGTSSGTEDTESPSAGSGDAEHEHVFTASVSISSSAKTLTVSYKCSCGEDLTSEVCVSFRGSEGAYAFYPVSGKVDFSSVPAGSYTVCLFFEDAEVTSFTLSVSDDSAGTIPDEDSGEEDAGDDGTDDDYGSEEDEPVTGGEDTGDEEAEDDPVVLPGEDDGDDGGDSYVADEPSQTVEDSEGGGSGATTVIILLVVFVVVVGVIAAVWIVWRRRSKKQKDAEDSAPADADGEEDE